MSYKGKINQYTCNRCGGCITTIDRDEGTTPMALACRATSGCPGTMISSMYQVDQALTPDYEWWKPAKTPRNPDLRDHVKRGGLLIRKIDAEWFDTCCACGKIFDSRKEGVIGFDIENPGPYTNASKKAQNGDYCNRCAFLLLVG